ncbi:hypothetical protein AVEN_40495-1 [Araneus ventricosus]|uniref:Uncharacterized protein n=1 Tax=Araneus ventricosus TaxID=182803 RepID=A0A4Y2IK49_ARAVE|nr:hypothetical protein AVEN_40495-1 [Araneus ventricosus]
MWTLLVIRASKVTMVLYLAIQECLYAAGLMENRFLWPWPLVTWIAPYTERLLLALCCSQSEGQFAGFHTLACCASSTVIICTERPTLGLDGQRDLDIANISLLFLTTP